MEKTITQFGEIAEFLEDGLILNELYEIQEKQNSTSLYVPIIGQFSSGKSSFINRLLGRRVLPTMLSETTAFTTFLYYTENDEYAEIMTADSAYKISLESLLKLSQTNLIDEQSVSQLFSIDVKNDDILSINVYIKSKLLENGLVLIDTPGLNTVLNTHENRTKNIIPQADLIVYVLGKSLTKEDINLYQSLSKVGIDVLFIRTKLDQLRSSENDTPDSVMLQDKKLLNEAVSDAVIYFGLSNEEELIENPYWKSLYEEIEDYFIEKIIFSVNEIKHETQLKKLRKIQSTLIYEIDDKRRQYEANTKLTNQQLTEEINSIEQDIQAIDDKIGFKSNIHDSKMENVRKKLVSKANHQFEELFVNYSSELELKTNLDDLYSVANEYQQGKIGNHINLINEVVQQNLQNYLKEATEEANDVLKELAITSLSNNISRIDLTIPEPKINNVFETGYNIQTKLENNIDVINEEFEELNEKERLLVQEINKAQSMRNQYDNEKSKVIYTPEYRERISEENRQIMKNLGKAVDIGLMFIPVLGPMKAINVVDKGTKLSKIAVQASKGANVAIKHTNTAIKGVQRVHKAHTSLSAATERVSDQTGFNLLDKITAEYWFEQMGKNMDGPPKLYEDLEVKNQFLREKNIIDQRIQQERQRELAKLNELNLLRDKKQQFKEERELENKYRELKRREEEKAYQKHIKRVEEEQIENYRNNLKEKFIKELDQMQNQYLTSLDKYLMTFLTNVPLTLTVDLQKKLYMKKNNLNETIEMRNKSQKEQEAYISKLNNYMQILSSQVS